MIKYRHLLLILCTLFTGNVLSQADISQTGTSQTMAAYWDTPIASQSPSPPTPETCGECHSDKYSAWKGSRHARAFSPGLLGQIIDYYEADAASCLSCHAPLAEQQREVLQSDIESLASNMTTQPPNTLAQHGVYCAVCHLRDGVLHAPSVTTSKTEKRVHRNTRTEPSMRDSRFCAYCHQFDSATAVNGKPLQNTYREWLESPHAKRGISCQSCHMPDSAHLFRGIHDPDMVRQGLSISTQTTKSSVDLIVESSGIGHRFPTYSVARVRLTATPVDLTGDVIPDGYRELIIQRLMSVEDGQWIELSDSRLEPGESVKLSMPTRINGICADKINLKIIVEPEWYYHDQVYPTVIEELEDGHARDLIMMAKSQSETTRYILFEQVAKNDCDD
jgi:hypothetical protein